MDRESLINLTSLGQESRLTAPRGKHRSMSWAAAHEYYAPR